MTLANRNFVPTVLTIEGYKKAIEFLMKSLEERERERLEKEFILFAKEHPPSLLVG